MSGYWIPKPKPTLDTRRDYLLDVRAMVAARTIEGAIDVAQAMDALGRYDAAADAKLRSRPDFSEVRRLSEEH